MITNERNAQQGASSNGCTAQLWPELLQAGWALPSTNLQGLFGHTWARIADPDAGDPGGRKVQGVGYWGVRVGV